MADTTVVAFTKNPAVEFRANKGYTAEMGAKTIQYAPANNADITSKGTLGWRDLGILETAPKMNDTTEVYDMKVGAITKTFGRINTGRECLLPVSIIAPTMAARRLANNTSIEVSYPSSPVNTTVDAATVNPTQLSVVVDSVTGLSVGDTLEIVTGSATYGTDKEYTRIKSINTTSKEIKFSIPIIQLPEDGAAVKLVASYKETALVSPAELEYQFRIVEYLHTDDSIEITHMPNVQLRQAQGVDSGDGKTPKKYNFELGINAEPVLDGSGNITDYLLWTKERIY